MYLYFRLISVDYFLLLSSFLDIIVSRPVANAVRAPSARVSASAPPYLYVWSRPSHCLYHLTHALFNCMERLKTNRFAKKGHTIQLRLGARLCRIHGCRMGNVLRMAFTQNRVRSCTGTSLSLTMRLLSHGLSLPLRLS